MNFDQINQLSEFLKKGAREDLKTITLHEILGLTGSKNGCSIFENQDITRLLAECLSEKNEIICKTACLALVNISADETGVEYLSNAYSNDIQELISKLLKHILNPESNTADAACMTLSNLTRQSQIAAVVVNYLEESKIEPDVLINAFVKLNYNTKGCNLHYLGPLFSNLSQSLNFRRVIMNKEKCLLQRLLPFTQYEPSLIRRGGVVGTLRNCCFETEYHEWLLGSDIDILPHLLLPLAGPEELSDEENDKLPLDLQYLGEDKQREPDSDIRKMLLEAIHQLCATKFGREYLRSKNVYVILREYHKWEKDRTVLLACENIVDILIRTEDEINEDNLKEIEVPEKYLEKFEEMDKQYLEEN